jgi:hypothetical protein
MATATTARAWLLRGNLRRNVVCDRVLKCRPREVKGAIGQWTIAQLANELHRSPV